MKFDRRSSENSTCESSDGPKKGLQLRSSYFYLERPIESKIKTEICKNWELYGGCPFLNKCSFAHGLNEIKVKSSLPQNFKTFPCKSYFSKGFCSYGQRCQYLHSEVYYFSKFKDFIKKIQQENGIDTEKINFKFKNTFTAKLNSLQKYFQIHKCLENMTSTQKRLQIFIQMNPNN